MGKIKSAVITVILVAAIAVLAFFALFSWQVPGSNGVDRYNSFISSIHLGGDLSGEAHAVLYPEGVITAADYEYGKPVKSDDETDKEYADKLSEYVDKYEPHGNLYIEKDFIEDGEQAFKEEVKADAEVLSKRLAEKGYSDYSVSVQDGFTLKVAVPTNFTYSAYKSYDTTSRSQETNKISRTVQLLSFDGELTLRNTEVGKVNYDNILTPINADITGYFKNITAYSAGGNYAVRLNLTKEGREQLKTISNLIVSDASNDKAIGFYVGDNQLLSLTLSEEIDSNSFFISVDEAYSQDYAIILNSVVHNQTIKLNYSSNGVQVVYATARLGDLAAILLGVVLVLVLLAAVIYSIVRYKKLGLVSTLMIVIYALAMVTALMLLEIQLTLAGAVTAVLGLALICGSNFAAFECVREETKKGKTMQSSVKSGYKRVLTGILELHIVLVVVSLLLALVGVGELASCGFILLIATIASYILHWFTRLMWYVISSPVKNKFAFCGFKREELIDD